MIFQKNLKKYKQGFTLIELLVVIAIVGILSTIVLSSLSSARIKGQGTSIKVQLSNMRSQAELFYSSSGNNYGNYLVSGTCSTAVTTNIFGSASTGTLKPLLTGVNSIQALSSTNSRCAVGNTGESAGTGSSWALGIQDPSNTANFFCVDGFGASKTSAQTASTVVTQDATSARCT